MVADMGVRRIFAGGEQYSIFQAWANGCFPGGGWRLVLSTQTERKIYFNAKINKKISNFQI